MTSREILLVAAGVVVGAWASWVAGGVYLWCALRRGTK